MKNKQRLKRVLYILTVCIATANYVKAQITLNLTPSNVNCEGLKTGQITANVSGGMPPYQFKWSNGQNTQTISSLHGGYYHCVVSDVNGNTAEKEITLTEPEEFRIVQFDAMVYSNNYNTSCYGCNDGAITVSVTGGTPPYTYAWSDGSNLQNRTNLVAKDYQLVVTDAFGCQLRELNKELSKPERDDWTAGGNVNNNQNAFFGTKAGSNYPDVIFKTADVEGFKLKSNLDALFSGRIGVGTTTPTEKFEVSGGNAKFGGNTTVLGELTMPNKANPNFNLIGFDANGNLTTNPTQTLLTELYKDAGSFTCTLCPGYAGIDGLFHSTPMWRVFSNSYTPDGYLRNCTPVSIGCTELPANTMFHVAGNLKVEGNTTQQGDINLIGSGDYLKNGVPLQLSQWANNVNGINYNSGNVGLGTTNPTQKLEIFNGALKFDNSSPVFQQWTVNQWRPHIQMPISSCIATNTANSHGLYLGFGIANDGWYFIRSSDNLNLQASSDLKQYAVYIKDDGLIIARRVLVDLVHGWGDNVFDNNYNLTPLTEVEKFIKANNHLPDVPSADQLKADGIDTEEMFTIQMKKIEELTLYSIELQKKLDLLSLEFEKLQSQK